MTQRKLPNRYQYCTYIIDADPQTRNFNANLDSGSAFMRIRIQGIQIRQSKLLKYLKLLGISAFGIWILCADSVPWGPSSSLIAKLSPFWPCPPGRSCKDRPTHPASCWNQPEVMSKVKHCFIILCITVDLRFLTIYTIISRRRLTKKIEWKHLFTVNCNIAPLI